MVELENWSVVDPFWNGCQRFPYMDEFRKLEVGHALHGTGFGHPKIEMGHRIRTSPIKEIDGFTVITQSGTVYKLLSQYGDYTEWLKQQA